MGQWQFIPWNLQYLGGGLLALATTILVFRRDPRNVSYRSFLAYGTCVIAWMFLVFLSRNAPSAAASEDLYRVVILAFMVVQPLFLLTILQIGSSRQIYYLTLVPALFVGVYAMAVSPFDVSWTSLGWSYSLRKEFLAFSSPITFSYPVAIVTVLLVMVLKSKLLYLKRKYGLILGGFLLYFVPLILTNMVMWRSPDARPIGGFLLAIEFIFISYALYLKPGKITFAGSQSAGALNDCLFRFVRRLREIMPGKELGGDATHFNNVLQTTGLMDIVSNESSRQIFNTGLSSELEMKQTMDKITGLMRKEPWALRASKEYGELFVEFYLKMNRESTAVAGAWLAAMLHSHGGFLDKQDILQGLPSEARLPAVFKDLRPGNRPALSKEEPDRAYGILRRGLEYGFQGLCITKVEPRKIRTTHGLEKASLFWLTFQQMPTEETVSPNDLERLSNIVSLGIASSIRTIVLLDCLDQIVLANSIDKVRGVIAGLGKMCKENGAILLLPVSAQMITKEQMNGIEEELAR